MTDEPTLEMDDKALNTLAGELYTHLRHKATSPSMALLTCLVTIYHIWKECLGDDFEGWHAFISAQLAQLHLDNTRPEGPLQ